MTYARKGVYVYGMTTTASLTELSMDQLTAAMHTSADEYELRFAEFLATCQQINAGDLSAESRADMDGQWAACKAQAAMTGAIAAEITRRIKARANV